MKFWRFESLKVLKTLDDDVGYFYLVVSNWAGKVTFICCVQIWNLLYFTVTK